MKITGLVEVKYYQEGKGKDRSQLDGYLSYPSRYRFCNCWIDESDPDFALVRMVGGEGQAKFVDGFCPLFLGEYPAVIVKHLEDTSDEINRADRFELYED